MMAILQRSFRTSLTLTSLVDEVGSDEVEDEFEDEFETYEFESKGSSGSESEAEAAEEGDAVASAQAVLNSLISRPAE